MTTAAPIVRTRRANWFEPTFDLSLKDGLTHGDWALPDRAGVKRLFSAEDLSSHLENNAAAAKFQGISFTDCDFSGRFDSVGLTLVFKECKFSNCDFGSSTWFRVKFTNCIFERISLTQSTWKSAEFRECRWRNVGASGNETNLEEVFISNPLEFVHALSTNTSDSAIARGRANKREQLARLQETKATVARNIFNNLKNVGDEDTFYNGCRALLQQTCRARQARHFFAALDGSRSYGDRTIAIGNLLLADAEAGLVFLFGALTKWGGSIARPLVGLLLVVTAFIFIYHFGVNMPWQTSFEHSFDIATVTGYGRAVQATDTGLYLYTAWTELVLSILFYTIFFTVAVAKISRVR